MQSETVEKPALASKWAPEVIADSSGKWTGNQLRFATKAEAEGNVYNLMMRWTLGAKPAWSRQRIPSTIAGTRKRAGELELVRDRLVFEAADTRENCRLRKMGTR